MFRFCVLFLLLIAGCSNIVIPDTFRYEEIDAGIFKLASWQKISNKNGAIKIYIVFITSDLQSFSFSISGITEISFKLIKFLI